METNESHLSEPNRQLLERLHWGLVIARVVTEDRRIHEELSRGHSIPSREIPRDYRYPLRRVILLAQLRMFLFVSRFHHDEWIRYAVDELGFAQEVLDAEPLGLVRRRIIAESDLLSAEEAAIAESLKARKPWVVRSKTVGEVLVERLYAKLKDEYIRDRVTAVLQVMKIF